MNEFIFKSYGNSKQSISYCEVDKCKAVVELKQQLDQLKAKNEELKKWKKEHLKDVEFIERNPVIDILNSMADNILLKQRNDKLKQTLTEIKKFAEDAKDTDGYVSYMVNTENILQKISECEGNDVH